MDLLGRKAKAQSQSDREALGRLYRSYDEICRTSMAQSEALAELAARVESRESLIRDLLLDVGRLQGLLDSRKPLHAAKPPVHLDEAEAELEWQRDNKLISLSDYEQLLKDLEFQNAEIELDPDYAPRPDLTY